MKKAMYGICILLLTVFLLPVQPAGAQASPASKQLRIRKLNAKKQPTPKYDVQRVSLGQSQVRQWMQLQVSFDTAPEWMDQLDFTFYALVKAKKGQAKYTLFRSAISYVNVEKGSHEGVMYLHPSTLKRYGDVESMAVIVRVNGQLAAMESDPKSKQRWWEQLSPVDGYLLNRMETPFAMINYDNYPAVKASGSNR